ncbi:hypothetical protein GCM10010842_12940 [Deinococcus daejeonensis]|uniref:Lipoprotein n=2 Tax=Deinococcus daejeonensis TaxID=1007098 RepID=A0ABQ2IZ73_9DEIO|nr:hypothetical protein GCM10010842_12940 [Deinococcus daejeonensis]
MLRSGSGAKVNRMNKVILAALATPVILASCGTALGGSDGSEKILSVATSHTSAGAPVLCNSVNGADTGTQITIALAAAGTLQNVKVNLTDAAGTTFGTTDVSGSTLLKGDKDGEYKLPVTRRANKSLTVNSAVTSLAAVTVSGSPVATLKADIVINRSRSSVKLASTVALPVYASCTK